MVKDRAIVCPRCGSKKVTKRMKFECDCQISYESCKGRYQCVDCGKTSTTHEMLPAYQYKKKK